MTFLLLFFFFQAEDGIRALYVTGVQTCALPISTTGWPFFSDWAALWAMARQHVTVANSRSLSAHSPVSRSKRREVDAMRKLATGTPEFVWRSRGTSTTLPTIVMYVSFIVRAPVNRPVVDPEMPSLGTPRLNR